MKLEQRRYQQLKGPSEVWRDGGGGEEVKEVGEEPVTKPEGLKKRH